MTQSLRRHALLLYFGLAFLLSWSLWVPLALNYYSLLPVQLNEEAAAVLPLLGTLGPAISASLVCLLVGRKAGLRELWGQVRLWRVHWAWYSAAGLALPALALAAAWIYRLLSLGVRLPYKNLSPGEFLVTAIILAVSVTGEEVGWRGFALPRMQKRWSALQSSLLLGSLHTLWHLPFWTALGELELFGWSYWILSWTWVLALSIYITWVMNNTGNSLLMALLLHGTLNVVLVGYLPVTTVVPAYILLILSVWTLALVVLRRYGSNRLVRAAEGTWSI